MASKDSSLYGLKRHKLSSDREIASSNSLAFSSQLSSLIGNNTNSTSRSTSKASLKPRKDDIFTFHNRSKKLKREHKPSSSLDQVHTTDGESLDSDAWSRSKRKMEEKARLYAAMKRGDVEDADEKYAVDFDKKWAERVGEASEVSDEGDKQSDDDDPNDLVDYVDELGRERRGTRAAAAKAARNIRREEKRKEDADWFTARPSAPINVIYGDAIQHEAFDPDAPVAEQMAELARKRDRSRTPPGEEHFDSKREVRTKGTGFFQFSGDTEERKRQMEGLEKEREETERRRTEREDRLRERREKVEERRKQVSEMRAGRQADAFLEELGEELARKGEAGANSVAVSREGDEGGDGN